MVRLLESLEEIASDFDAIVLDQWGVLHDGSAPYPFAVEALARLKGHGLGLAVLSNSGKRAAPNEAQLTMIGVPPGTFDCVMTSGEALWREFAAGAIQASRLHPIARRPGDPEAWAVGLDLSFAPIEQAEAVLLMGLPDSGPSGAIDDALSHALDRDLQVYCSNPDRSAPRSGGARVVSPGTLAHDYEQRGGRVQFIGKPQLPVFRAVEAALGVPKGRLVMVGDSLEHDIAGAHAAGWQNAFVRGGLHAGDFASGAIEETVIELAQTMGVPEPDFTLDYLR